MKRNYGSISEAYRLGKSGDDDGMVGIINTIRTTFKKEHQTIYVDYIIDTYINPNDYDYLTELMKQFMEKHYHLFLEEMSNRKLSHIVHNYRKYLETHLRYIGQTKKRFRGI